MDNDSTTTTPACGRATTTGSGTPVICELPVGHAGAHKATWVDFKGVKQNLLTWTHENYSGSAVWPETKGARDVTGVYGNDHE